MHGAEGARNRRPHKRRPRREEGRCVSPWRESGSSKWRCRGFVTSAGAVLCDWGADVLKVEHPVTGDPQRGLRRTGPITIEGNVNPNFEHPNRGKRSIGLDIGTDAGREVLYDLVRQSDVFL